MPGLDGLRAVAVSAVIAFHLGVPWAAGGLLGVGVFFTLSGYLITDLLVAQWQHSGSLHLGDFWMRRARRLLPAVVVLLAATVVWVSVWHGSQLGELQGNVVAAAGYVSNWWLIFHHVSYFARFGPPSPLGHLWSLAVEEQFYLVWPWLLWLGLRFVRSRRVVTAVIVVAAAASAVEMSLLYHPGVDPTRVYDGTDTRAFGLLIGAALAVVWPLRPSRASVARWNRKVIDAIGIAGLVGVAVMIWRVGQYAPFLYRGGLVVLSVATAAIVAAVVFPRSRIGIVLGMRPLRWIGLRSYGIYLWHYPIIVLTTPTITRGVDVPRSVLQVAATLAAATLSWRFVEAPVRRRTRRWLQAHEESAPRLELAMARWSWALSAGMLGALAVFSLTLIPTIDAKPTETPIASTAITRRTTPPAPPPATGPATSVPQTTPTTVSTTTSCRAVVHIGDSTSESLTSPNYLPDPTQRLDAQFNRVGVASVNLQISGARSIVETYKGEPNGLEVAQQLVASGFRGCWVIALGTNDAADIAVGSNVSASQRVSRMMAVIGNQPVMWVGADSLLGSGPYANANMARWDQALVQACGRYTDLRVYDWAAVAQSAWFITDGIHYSSPGSAARAQLIASALAVAFPAAGRAPPCVIQ